MLWKKISILLFTFILGVLIGVIVNMQMSANEEKRSFVERREGGYQYINPLLECDIAETVLRNRELRPFKHKIETYLHSGSGINKNVITSVYYRKLNDGLWFSIGETEKFVPASLRKLPLMIALLKQAEKLKTENFLDRTVTFDLNQDHNANQNIKPSQTMIHGQDYTVRDLIYRMIVYSDNNAFSLLTKVVDVAELDSVYPRLRMLNPQAMKDDEYLSIQTYSSFLRMLFNASFLSKESSEWALGVLTKTEFNAGIVSGVPKGIPVAHKFGEKSDASTGLVQLHDCGIVYYPQSPYLLCIMSKGPNFEVLDDTIRGVSRIVFDEIDSQHSMR